MAHADGKRWLLVGLGKRADFTPERARVAAAGAHARALELSTRDVVLGRRPGAASPGDGGVRAALVEGTALADYRFDRHRSAPPDSEDAAPKHLQALIVSAPDADATALEREVAEAATVAAAVNAARDLQNRPANDLTPTALAAHAQALAQEVEGLSWRRRDARDSGARHGRVRGGRPGLRAGAGADRAPLRRDAAGRPIQRAPCWASWARR